MVYHNTTLGLDYYDVSEASRLFDNIINNGIKYDGKKIKYCDISATFDIESSSFIDDGNKVALMYIWQFGITNDVSRETYVIIGRTWNEFLELLNIIASKFVTPYSTGKKATYYFPIFIHNLGFEFSFLRPILKDYITEVFAIKSQTPLYFRIPHIEFRCSYLLSGVSLNKLDTTTWHKAVGDLDYSLMRHKETPLTDKEMSYCLLDVLVLCEYISNKRQQEGNIYKIPFTKTGYARRGLREYCLGTDYKSKQRKDYISRIKALNVHNFAEYITLNRAYTGGHTACNPWYNGKVVEDVTCYDFTSSYPSVMVCEDRFPSKYKDFHISMGVNTAEYYISQRNAFVCMATYTNIESKYGFDDWINCYKIVDFKENDSTEINNGKLHKHDGDITLFITEVDYEIYKMFYKYDSVKFEYVYVYETDYLPKSVIEYTLKLYSAKTELKGVAGKEVEYTLGKEQLNSLYGMSVTDICRDNLNFDVETGEWKTELNTQQQLSEKVEQYNKNVYNGKVATPYIWGVYISALARRNLALGILYSGKKGLWVYADTDSIYVKNAEKIKDFIDTYNKLIEEKMNIMCEHMGFDKDIWKPKTVKGIEKPLGYWDFDGHSKRFKTLGAKRYIKEKDDGSLSITVAGLGKNDGGSYMLKHWKNNLTAVFKNFDDGLTIPEEYTGKLTHTIITEKRCGKLTDHLGKTIDYIALGGTHLSNTSFVLSLNPTYKQFLVKAKDRAYL